jgi:cadmium resistance protein CadD (predicted permease)
LSLQNMNGLWMESKSALLGIAIVLFAVTNIDDVFVLIGFFADPKFRTRDIVLGQYLGIAALVGVSAVASLLSLMIPRAYIGLLGVLPIVIGVKKLFDLYRNPDDTEETLEHRLDPGGYGRVATVALVTVANGGDNIGIYTPSFAIRTGNETALIVLVFAVMTALWCFFAYWMVNHPTFGAPIRRYGHRVTPFALIGLGMLIVYQQGVPD